MRRKGYDATSIMVLADLAYLSVTRRFGVETFLRQDCLALMRYAAETYGDFTTCNVMCIVISKKKSVLWHDF